MKTCAHTACGQEFRPPYSTSPQKYCSQRCARAAQDPASLRRSTSFEPGVQRARPSFCDTDAARRTCAAPGCGQEFRAKSRAAKTKYCSTVCASNARRQDKCGKCGGEDWYIKPGNGKRSCRTCRNANRSTLRNDVVRHECCALPGCGRTFTLHGPRAARKYCSSEHANAARGTYAASRAGRSRPPGAVDVFGQPLRERAPWRPAIWAQLEAEGKIR